MAASPATPPGRPSRRRADETKAPRTVNLTDTLADALLPRSASRRVTSKSVGTKSPASAEIRRREDKGESPTGKLSTPLGPYDGNSVRDRVRKWQQDGGGVIEAPPPVVHTPQMTPITGEVNTDNEGTESHARSGRREKEEEVEVGETTNGSRKAKVREGARKAERTRTVISPATPKKRVVSDAHWVTKRETVASPERPQSAKPPKSNGPAPGDLADDGIRVRPIGPRSADSTRKKRRERDRGTQSKPVLDDDGIRVYSTSDIGPKQPDDGIRVYAIPESRSRHPEPEESRGHSDGLRRSRSGSESARSGPRSPTSPTPPQRTTACPTSSKATTPAYDPSAESDPKKTPKEPLGERKDSTHGKATSPRELDKPTKRPASKSFFPKVNFLREAYDEGRKILERSQPEPELLPRPSGNRVEAWLSETPDPFVDGDLPVTEIQLPPRLEAFKANRPRRRKSSIQRGVDESLGEPDPSQNRTAGGITRTKDRQSPGPERSESFDGPEQGPADHVIGYPRSPNRELNRVDEQAPSLASPTLKRAGAKKLSSSPTMSSSPTKGRRTSSPVKEITPEDGNARSTSVLRPSCSPNASSSLEPSQEPNMSFTRPLPFAAKPKLSTIASVETLATRTGSREHPTVNEQPEDADTLNGSRRSAHKESAREPDAGETEMKSRHKTSLKRRLTTHADLISVLSLPRAGSRSIRSARSIKSSKSKLAAVPLQDLLSELVEDERKYMRELNTLVDGVIPVLLTCVLSKSDSAIAAGLFRSSSHRADDPNFTRPVIDMGIALERLRSLHKRIPLQDSMRLVQWSEGARKVYTDYLKSWKMGFQDVVINLAPANSAESGSAGEASSPQTGPEKDQSMNEGLPRNADGDVVDVCGKRIDVAYLLKRPLVRIKKLSKTLKGIDRVNPSPAADEQASHFQTLTLLARRRVNEEQARLEDEGAASVDTTRARDPHMLSPAASVAVDPDRRLIARDSFTLFMQHSSGQRMDCRVELLLREDAPGKGSSGDLLICELGETNRWLLFPPIALGRYSARTGDVPGEFVVMIRGSRDSGTEWHELLSLTTDDEPTSFEWVQMLGLNPAPRPLIRQEQVTNDAAIHASHSFSLHSEPATPKSSRNSTPPTFQAVEDTKTESIERAVQGENQRTSHGRRRSSSRVYKEEHRAVVPTTPSGSSKQRPSTVAVEKSSPLLPKSPYTPPPPQDLNEAMVQAGSGSSLGLRRTKAKRITRSTGQSATSSHAPSVMGEGADSALQPMPSSQESPSGTHLPSSSKTGTPRTKPLGHSSDSAPGSDRATSEEYSSPDSAPDSPYGTGRPRASRTSSVPSLDPPTIPKLRKSSPTSQIPNIPLSNEGMEEAFIAHAIEDEPTSNPDREQSLQPGGRHVHDQDDPLPPRPPPHRSPSPLHLKNGVSKLESPSPGSKLTTGRRTSSPLKHEYAPSSPSESVSRTEFSTDEEEVAFSTSSEEEVDEAEELEGGDVPTPLLPVGAYHRSKKASPQGSLYSQPNATLTPSESASQAPYKSVPQQPAKAATAIASIFTWSDRGFWDSLHPTECSIVVTPGLIEAFEMSNSHSKQACPNEESEGSPSSSLPGPEESPLIGLELTPLVPLRRGTAVDISIRSPPTSRSKLSSGRNVMFRSRNPEECEALYALINDSRINNPTYIALQNARGSSGMGAGFGPEREATARRSGWWGWRGVRRRSSYRASGALAPSISLTESSAGTAYTAFSALRIFGNGGRFFNIAKSTVSARKDGAVDSIYSSSSSSSNVHNGKAALIGVPVFQIRLYRRVPAGWRNMGKAQLQVSRPSPDLMGHGFSGEEKRIVITGRTAGETLLDACLMEGAFERVANTGIAIRMFEDVVGPNGEVGQVGAVGGVVGAKAKVFMMRMNSPAEAGYVFGLVGKLRY